MILGLFCCCWLAARAQWRENRAFRFLVARVVAARISQPREIAWRDRRHAIPGRLVYSRRGGLGVVERARPQVVARLGRRGVRRRSVFPAASACLGCADLALEPLLPRLQPPQISAYRVRCRPQRGGSGRTRWCLRRRRAARRRPSSSGGRASSPPWRWSSSTWCPGTTWRRRPTAGRRART